MTLIPTCKQLVVCVLYTLLHICESPPKVQSREERKSRKGALRTTTPPTSLSAIESTKEAFGSLFWRKEEEDRIFVRNSHKIFSQMGFYLLRKFNKCDTKRSRLHKIEGK